MTDSPAEPTADAPYRVLARKYRPATFDDLIGQAALVRTLTNAIEGGRLAHAFVLTGVRGVGKTTTARIIARALNCVGPDGAGGPTPQPCGACEPCLAIAQDRHVDVIEMDAASRTGVADIRELIEGVRYRPVQARYKVYIIDEVHMLSTNAFNALLKTLEEPPEHVIFIFATTEIRKVPVTVLSRCQRFDLRRVDQALLAEHFAKVSALESVQVDPEALAMIARAADGSVRDGLSLLDQAMALAGGAAVEEGPVRAMLGLADRARTFDLFEVLMKGQAPEALAIFQELYAAGADPAVVLQDLLELTHLLTRGKLVPESLESQAETERQRGRALVEKLSMPALARSWQMLLKGLGETNMAPAPLQAAEMVLIRLAYAANLPTPVDLVQKLQSAPDPAPGGGTAAPPARAPAAVSTAAAASAPPPAPPPAGAPQAQAAPQRAPDAAAPPEAALQPQPASFTEVVDLARRVREMTLANELLAGVHLVSFEPGRIEFRPHERAAPQLAGQLGKFLLQHTGERWVISLSQAAGEATLRDQLRAAEAAKRDAVLQHPLVQAVIETFPGAEMVARRDKEGPGGALPDPDETPEGDDPA